MKKTLFTILSFGWIFLGGNSIAQTNVLYQWTKAFGSSVNDGLLDLAVDAEGNVYTTGYFSQTIDFDPGTGTTNLSSSGSYDVFLAKYNSYGALIWAKSFGSGSSNDVAFGIDLDQSGNPVIAGYFTGSADFDPGPGTTNLSSTSGSSDIFVAKFSTSGNLVWARAMGGTGFDQAYDVTVSETGNLFITGYYSGTADLDPGSNQLNFSSTPNAAFLSVLNENGDFVDAKVFAGASSTCKGFKVKEDISGSVYITGVFGNTIDFDPGTGVNELSIVNQNELGFLVKLDAALNFLWVNKIGSSDSNITISGLALDNNGATYINGAFMGTHDFNPGTGTENLTSAGNYDVLTLKFDMSGNLLWAKRTGSTDADYGKGIFVDESNNVIIGGTFKATVDFDPGIGTTNYTNVGFADIFVQCLDQNGVFLFAKAIGGSADDDINTIVSNGGGDLYIGGTYNGTVDFDFSAGTSSFTSVGQRDLFMSRWSYCTAPPAAPVLDGPLYFCEGTTNTYSVAFNPSYSYEWSYSNSWGADINNNTITFSSMSGADVISVYTYNLCGNSPSSQISIASTPFPDINISLNGITLTSAQAGATYQWLDCDNGMSAISGETGQSFTAAANGSYAVEIDLNGCVDTSACEAITTVGLDDLSTSNLKLYPNPSTNKFTVEAENGIDQVAIYSMAGELMLMETFTGTATAEPTPQLNPGVYLVKVTDAAGNLHITQWIKL